MREVKKLKDSLQAAQLQFEVCYKNNIEATEKVFRTAYESAKKSHLSFTESVTLQSQNSVKCGSMLHLDHTCNNILYYIASEMCHEIVTHILFTNAYFSFLVEESTSVYNSQSQVVYVCIQYDGEVCVYFFALIAIESMSAAGLQKSLLEFLFTIGFTGKILKRQFIGFCSDSAS